jgi:hypothetical protein
MSHGFVRTAAKAFFLGMLAAVMTSQVACNTSRNFDQTERDRRMYGPGEQLPDGKTEIPPGSASPILSFNFGNVSKEESLIRIEVSGLFIDTEKENPYLFRSVILYVDVHAKEIFTLASTSTLKKIGEIACKNELLTCPEFVFTSKVGTIFSDQPLPIPIAELPVTITYQKMALDMELWDLVAQPAKLLSKFEGVRLTSSFFPENHTQMLYSLSPMNGGLRGHYLQYVTPEKEFYGMDYHLTPPAAGLIFNDCTTTESSDFLSLMIHCFFLNPATREIVSTKQALVHAKKN